jgi:hypothetical protein
MSTSSRANVHSLRLVQAHGLLTRSAAPAFINRHGALILTAVALRVGMKIGVHVLQTGKRAIADVVYVDPEQPRHCGINLEKPENICGLPSPPNDWHTMTNAAQ